MNQNMRPVPAILDRPPSYRWPEDAHKIPTHCTTVHCGARLIVSDYPTAEHRVVDLSCLMCSRVAAELVIAAPSRAPLVIEPGKRGRRPASEVADEMCAECFTGTRWAGRRICRDCLVAHNRGQWCTRCGVHPRLSDRTVCHYCRKAGVRRVKA